MFIQLDKVGLVNKGAELLMHAVVEHLYSSTSDSVKFVIGRECQGSFEDFRRLNFYQVANLQFCRVKWHNLIDKNQLEKYGLVRRSQVEAIVDAAGYQFGDKWYYSDDRLDAIVRSYEKVKKNRGKIILLPQAFGPFNEDNSKKTIDSVYNHVDCIFARDKLSYKYLTDRFGDDKLELYPDFTSLVNVDVSLKLCNIVKGSVCIVPNIRMVTKRKDHEGRAYIDFLKKIIKYLSTNNHKVVVLNHEGEGDRRVINEVIHGNTNEKVVVLDCLSAKEIKAAIGNCKLLVSSRYHGVINGLNQFVPTFCTSWGHKYIELMEEYGLTGNVLFDNHFDESIDKLSSALRNPKEFMASKEVVGSIKSKTKNMWKIVDEVMSGRKNG